MLSHQWYPRKSGRPTQVGCPARDPFRTTENRHFRAKYAAHRVIAPECSLVLQESTPRSRGWRPFPWPYRGAPESSSGSRRRCRDTRQRPAPPRTFRSPSLLIGELPTARGLDGNGSPGLRPGRVGPRPVANSDKTWPAAAGLDALTREKSFEWVTAGPPVVITISGRDIGIT
jgi:hypothetical protein